MISQLIEPALACAPLAAASMQKFIALLMRHSGIGICTKSKWIQRATNPTVGAQASKKFTFTLISAESLQGYGQRPKDLIAAKTVVTVGIHTRAATGCSNAEEWRVCSDSER